MFLNGFGQLLEGGRIQLEHITWIGRIGGQFYDFSVPIWDEFVGFFEAGAGDDADVGV